MAQIINAAPTKERNKRLIGGFHWILLVLTVAATLLTALPTLTSQPPLYDTISTIYADPSRYGAFFSDPAVQTATINQAQTATQRSLEEQGYTGYGSARFGAAILPQPDGTVKLDIHALNPEASQAAANILSDRLMRAIRATAGRDILQRVMAAEEYRMWQGEPIADDWNRYIRRVIAFGSFDFPVRATPNMPKLSDEDYNDIARAMEVRFDQLSWYLSDPVNSGLTPLERRDKEVARKTLADFLNEQYPQFQFTGMRKSASYITQQAALPVQPRTSRVGLQLAIVLTIGLVSGLMLVFIDRSIGIIDKIKELWGYRELVRNLVVRDLKARYKSSVLGYFWSLLNPLLMIILFYFVFQVLLGSNIVDFHIFLMVALLPWNYFAGGLTEGMMSIVGNSNLVQKVYFPREILPLSAVFSNLINFLLSLPVLFVVILVTGGSITLTALLLPVIIILETVFLLGLVLFLSALAVFFRDITHIMAVILQLWFFITPIFYPLEGIASGVYAKIIRWANPMASLVDFYRDILYGGVTSQPTPGLPALDGVARTAFTVFAVLAMGAFIFHRLSNRFGEEL